MSRARALEQLRGILREARSKEDEELHGIIQARDDVIGKYQPLFSNERLGRLTKEEFSSFLLYDNNRHWKGIHRYVGSLTKDMERLRGLLTILLDESRPLKDRLEELRPRSGKAPVSGLGQATLTPILLVRYPNKYGVLNRIVEEALQGLGLWPDVSPSTSFAERYCKVNEVLCRIADELDVDLWTLDALWWRVRELDVNEVGWSDQLKSRIEATWNVGDEFSLAEIYKFEGEFQQDFPQNKNVRSKLRQTLQLLRDDGVLEFLDQHGTYRRPRSLGQRFWWVNQGQAYKAQRDGGYVWAPQRTRGGTTSAHHSNVRLVSAGDIVLHYANKSIRAIGLAEGNGREQDRPAELSQNAWSKDGYLAQIVYWELPSPIGRDEIPIEWRTSSTPGPFDVNGSVKQGYLFPLDGELVERMQEHFAERWPVDSPWSGLLPKYFKIAPGTNGEIWDECRDHGVICVGWDALGDLGKYESLSTLRGAMEEHYGEELKDHAPTISRTANRLWDFKNLRVGDRVIANRGTSVVLGIGTVKPPGYEWKAKRDGFRHVVPIEWDTSVAGSIPDQGARWRQTIVPITKELYQLIASGESVRPFERLIARLADAGLYFPGETISNYLLALQTKGFAILTGISGTGKTKLAMHVARSLASPNQGKTNEQLCVVAVRPDWTDNRGLLGWQNPITNKYVLTPTLRLLLRANAELEASRREERVPRPYFLVLDEMNVARVEHFFSDFLSCLESDEPLRLHHDGTVGVSGYPDMTLSHQLPIPHNVFITGTVNVDETTYNFSPKVLDRAFTIELNQVDLRQLGEPKNALPGHMPLYLDNLPPVLHPYHEQHRGATSRDWTEFRHLQGGDLADEVAALNDLLEADNRHFGYRVANEIALFTNLAAKQAGNDKSTLWSALDLALMQKVLPKFHGTEQELKGVLRRLLAFATTGSPLALGSRIEDEWQVKDNQLRPHLTADAGNADSVRLPRLAHKIFRMIRRLRKQGFTSFIE